MVQESAGPPTTRPGVGLRYRRCWDANTCGLPAGAGVVQLRLRMAGRVRTWGDRRTRAAAGHRRWQPAEVSTKVSPEREHHRLVDDACGWPAPLSWTGASSPGGQCGATYRLTALRRARPSELYTLEGTCTERSISSTCLTTCAVSGPRMQAY